MASLTLNSSSYVYVIVQGFSAKVRLVIPPTCETLLLLYDFCSIFHASFLSLSASCLAAAPASLSSLDNALLYGDACVARCALLPQIHLVADLHL